MNLKKLIPVLVAIAVFGIITLVQFSPLLGGKVLEQGDIVRYRGMSQEANEFRKTEHAEPLWTNSMFGGMPAYQVSTLYPGNWLGGIDKVFHLFLPHPSGYIFLCFLGFFILLLCLDVDPWLALVGSLAYGFSSYFFIILEAGHNSKANAIGYVAPLLGGIILLMKGRYWLGFALTTLFMALELNANHVQITYYAFLLFGIILISYFITAIRQKTLKPYFIGVGLFLAASLIGVLPNAGNLLATSEYGNYTTRGKSELTITPNGQSNATNKTSGLDKDYATQWSYGIDETFTFIIPNYKGGASSAIANTDKDALKKVDPQLRDQIAGSSAYFGDQPFTSGPVYIGAIVMLLAFLGLFIIDSSLKWPLFIATVLSVMLAWGHNFMGLTSFFMDHVPGYNKFRAVAMILVIAELTIPLLAVLALDKFIKATGSPLQKVTLKLFKTDIELKKVLIISVAVVGGFCFLGAFMPGTINSFTANNEEAQVTRQFKQSGATDQQVAQFLPEYMHNLEIAREDIFKSDARRSLIFVGLASLFLFLFLMKKLKLELFYVSLAIFILADLWPVADRYLNSKNFVSKASYDAPPAKSGADEHILADKSLDYRVLNLSVSPWQDASTSYYHKSIGGYHGAKLKKYQEIIDFHLDNEINTFYGGINTAAGNDSAMDALFSKLGVLNMLNTKYIMIPSKDQLIPLQNPEANGNAWFIRNVKEVANADEEITGLGKINTKTDVIIQQKNKEGVDVKPQYDGNGSIKLLSYKPNDLVYETDASTPQFAVFSEIYYPKGWNAYVDGNLQNHTCVDYVLRGMNVPAGKHKIEFKFEPAVYKTGNTVAMIGSLLLLLTVAGSLFMFYKKEKTAPLAA
ncbi:MAG: YfhO family protein [Bacteroidetes bacterium]|nr:YfhO family protein [Bacteroidota bacterium]